MNKIIGTAILSACLLALAGFHSARAQNKGKVQVNASPPDAKAKVWIDGKSVGNAPAGVDLAEGEHYIRVKKDTGETYERKVMVKPDAKLEIVADFGKKEISVTNEKALGYDPYKSGTVRILTSTEPEPPPEVKEPPAGEKPAGEKPAEAAAGAGDKPADTGAPAEKKRPGYRECAPGEWCPEPKSNSVGPPIPPEVRKPAGTTEPSKDGADKIETAKVDIKTPDKDPDLKTPEAKTPEAKTPEAKTPDVKKITSDRPGDKKLEEKKPAPEPCLPKTYSESCDLYGGTGDAKSALYSYYCTLANHDLDRAYKMWSISEDLNWFYASSSNFCAVDDFRLRNISTAGAADGQVNVNYNIDLIDGRGRVIETRAMTATLVKRGESWAFRKNVRQ